MATYSKNFIAKRLSFVSSYFNSAIIINLIVAVFVIFSGINQSDSVGKLYWFCILIFVFSLRILNHVFLSNDNNIKYHCYFIGVFLTGLTWAVFPILFFEDMQMSEKFVTLVVFSSLAGGAVNVLSSDIRSAFSYITFLLIPFSILLLFQPDDNENVLGILGIVLWFILCFVSAIRAAKDVKTSINNEIKLDLFIHNLEKEVQVRTEKIINLEQRDNLTQLFNRGSFFSNVDLDLAQNINNIKAVLFLDMDDFKILNDKYGHEFGDFVLAETGKRLLSIEKKREMIACRWGGDEFILYSCHASKAELISNTTKLVDNLTQPVVKDNLNIRPSFKVGLFYTRTNFDLTQAIKYADVAMYEGKKNRNEISIFDERMMQALNREEMLRRSIKESVEQGGFHLCYQPIVDIIDNKIITFEVLLRWHLNDEFIPPSEFIDIAERYGQINFLGEFVLEQAIASLSKLNKLDNTIALSINVSVLQLESHDFIIFLKNLLNRYCVNTNNIHLEITETIMIKNLVYLSKVITQLKSIGVRISIDDFGTGFSSISVLKELSVDYIKIDKSYVDNICEHSKDKSIVSAVTKMSHMIGCKVIAEGVERNDQLALLKGLEVDSYQGYLFSKPVKFEQALELLR
ncbi:bifunctional diguanylate cyclase/phosphodiesterase [Pseudoalteromonas sp. SR44-5]|uniref:putative bifunctional diguanylate cyclase/phosphodiesterase n=1 Tax=unclassified Pseudoalteromonas TaxID=194690 RepID=UPI001600B076|nr:MULTISPECIES: bifunctional diguanylate cyclase/phosphodiesterase [unclassified Pseudoalteromonas]MBB1332062.1 bifunctional diguanylate cyclase/phosphodiesterase [Pseudoalteromonas sp. SR41-6]MBB1365224.1 bifunctional diguanylate cyclase/phosphodiesterase [Pseudoalteromonas sp. SR44-5]MBB1457320.1 bifunctional diguanylate cyclase/phosphodiesterase [Pseudoalteromonas sp. SG41-8]MBB1470289.1 bifunctional diguanylate cyclase/phosphodiesterase [Pseudoalteromonas sp. SG41-5]